jgi:hypothetical protein
MSFAVMVISTSLAIFKLTSFLFWRTRRCDYLAQSDEVSFLFQQLTRQALESVTQADNELSLF